MEDMMKLLIFLCLVFWHSVFAAPLPSHESGGKEHIVIIDSNHASPPTVSELLERVELHEKHPDVRHVYNNSAFRGFAASLKSHCLENLSKMPDVSLVERTARVFTNSVSARDTAAYNTRSEAPWGLQRISTASSVGGNAEDLDYTYSYANNKLGDGADIYIIDTGIYTQNQVFGGRAQVLWSYDGVKTDTNGHGTHVSGTAGGDVLGVASNANIFGMKCLGGDGGGFSSNVVAAIDNVVTAHGERKFVANFRGSVMSMSLESGGPVRAISSAIEAAVRSGVHVVVAAGNNDKDACLGSPAMSGGTHGPAITVGAIDMTAERASFSNYGECVDVYAPGVNIISAWIGGPTMINILDGTSMATPHVTGIVAYAMANETLARSPALMKEWVTMTALSTEKGLLLANNGVQSGTPEGMLGFEKNAAEDQFTKTDIEGDSPVRKGRRDVGLRSVHGFKLAVTRIFNAIGKMRTAYA